MEDGHVIDTEGRAEGLRWRAAVARKHPFRRGQPARSRAAERGAGQKWGAGRTVCSVVGWGGGLFNRGFQGWSVAEGRSEGRKCSAQAHSAC